MLQLDHPDLEPFEPLIRDLMDLTFGRGDFYLKLRGLDQGAQWHTQAHREFRSACFSGFTIAQKAVGERILDLQARIVAARNDERKARRARDPVPKSIVEQRTVLEHRELVLRRLMDSIVWVLVWPGGGCCDGYV